MAIDWSSETAADLVVVSLAKGTMKINISGGRCFMFQSLTAGIKPGRWYLNTLTEAIDGTRRYWFVEASIRAPDSLIRTPWLWKTDPFMGFRIISSVESVERTPEGDSYYDWFYEFIAVGSAQDTVHSLLRRLVVGQPTHGGVDYSVPGGLVSYRYEKYNFPPKFIFVR